MADNEKLTDDQLVAAVRREMSTADYEGQSLLSEQRSEADLAYTSEYTRGTEPNSGMSSILINAFQPAVDTLTTYISNIFTNDKETVVFGSDDEELKEAARMVSKRINMEIHKRNSGYAVINRWIKDSFLHKTGIVKVSWDETPTHSKYEFEGTEAQLAIIMAEKEAQGFDTVVMEKEKADITYEVESSNSDEILEVTQENIIATIKCSKPANRIRLHNIPPEEFLINEGATAIDDDLTRFICHRQLKYISDVMEMFEDIDEDDLLGVGAGGYLEDEFETATRHAFDGTYDYDSEGNLSGSLRQIEVVESWIRADRDGDGIAEWRHVFTAGHTLLMDEEWFGPIPMCAFTPFPIPHKFYGLGLWDKLKDYHRTKTGLVRAAIDTANNKNLVRFFGNPRHISERDMKSGKPGLIATLPGFDAKDLVEVPKPSGNAGESVSLLQYLDQEIIAQIGIDPKTGVVSSDIEKSGNDAEKTAQVVDNASAKIETMAREFAETALKDAIWSIYEFLIQNNELEDYGLEKSDLTAKVGLGHQTARQKAQSAAAIIQQQVSLETTGVSPMQLPAKYKLNASKNLASALGEEDPSMFFPTEQEVALAKQQQMQQQMKMQQAAMQQAQITQQDNLQNSEAKRRLEDAKAIEAEVRAAAAERKQQLDEEAKVVEIENIKQDNDLNIRRQEAQEEQMAANLELQRANEELQRELAELKSLTSIEVAEIQADSREGDIKNLKMDNDK